MASRHTKPSLRRRHVEEWGASLYLAEDSADRRPLRAVPILARWAPSAQRNAPNEGDRENSLCTLKFKLIPSMPLNFVYFLVYPKI